MSKGPDKSETVPIGPHLAASGGFSRLYSTGMGLIEEVASYLDGEGRTSSRTLSREASFLYATESMRLTTRLMQLASWLLLQRAVNEGEISAENARVEKAKVKFSATPSTRGGPGWSDLPQQFVEYVSQGDLLFDQVVKFDQLERAEVPQTPSTGDNDIADQLAKLQAAFGRNYKNEE